MLCETTVTELAQDAYGKVIGVRTDRTTARSHADVVVLAEGVNGLLGTRAGLRARPKPDNVALAVKEMHFLPRETIEARFNLKGDEGVVIEAVGTISRGMTGMGFIYTNKECVSLGIGCLVSDFAEDRRDALRPARAVQAASVGRAADRGLRGQGILRAPDPRGRLQGDPAALTATAGSWSATPPSSTTPSTARARTSP